MRPSVRFWLAAAVACALTLTLARVSDPAPLTSWLLQALAIFLLFPVVIAAAMTVVSVCLAAVVLLLAAAGRVLQPARPSGIGPVLAESFAPAMRVLPGYLAALRRVRAPGLWGALFGIVAATTVLLLRLNGT